MVVAGGSDITSFRVYLAHLSVPGLPHLIDSHTVSTAQPLATRLDRAHGAVLALYPNPASETLTVALSGRRPSGPATLVLSDMLERAVFTQPLPAGGAQATVSVHGLPAGLYQVVVRAGGQVVGSSKLAVAR